MQDSHTEENEPEEDVKAPSAAKELLENTEEFSFPDDCNRPPAKPSSDDERGFLHPRGRPRHWDYCKIA
jgi:hypothetical protein